MGFVQTGSLQGDGTHTVTQEMRTVRSKGVTAASLIVMGVLL